MHAMKANGEMKVWLHSFLTLALDGDKGLASRLCCPPTRRKPQYSPQRNINRLQRQNGLDDLERKKSLVPARN